MKVALFDAYRASLIDVFVELISLCLFAHTQTHTEHSLASIYTSQSCVCLCLLFGWALCLFHFPQL